MRKYFAVFLIFIFVFSLAGCNSYQLKVQDTPSTSSVTKSISDYLIEEDGEQYLILPISNVKVRIWDEQIQYLDDIDIELLRTAEVKISGEISQYQNHSYFYLKFYEGYLCLCVEVIVDIDPPVASENSEGGCGIDHEHKFFVERITK